MIGNTLTLDEMTANVERSRGHVAKQEAMIKHFNARGQADLEAQACEVLSAMLGHLEVELGMLDRMTREATNRSS